MSASAFILVAVTPDKTESVGKALRSLPHSVVWEVLGPHDFILRVDRLSLDNLSTDVRGFVRSIPGVTGTTTCVVMGGGEPQKGETKQVREPRTRAGKAERRKR